MNDEILPRESTLFPHRRGTEVTEEMRAASAGAREEIKAKAESASGGPALLHGEPDLAIKSCSQSLDINKDNWRAYNNRSYAYYLKGRYRLADADLKKAQAINPNARQVGTIRGMINERTLQPSVLLEEHQ